MPGRPAFLLKWFFIYQICTKARVGGISLRAKRSGKSQLGIGANLGERAERHVPT